MQRRPARIPNGWGAQLEILVAGQARGFDRGRLVQHSPRRAALHNVPAIEQRHFRSRRASQIELARSHQDRAAEMGADQVEKRAIDAGIVGQQQSGPADQRTGDRAAQPLCCVGFDFNSPAALMNGTSVT